MKCIGANLGEERAHPCLKGMNIISRRLIAADTPKRYLRQPAIGCRSPRASRHSKEETLLENWILFDIVCGPAHPCIVLS